MYLTGRMGQYSLEDWLAEVAKGLEVLASLGFLPFRFRRFASGYRNALWRRFDRLLLLILLLTKSSGLIIRNSYQTASKGR